MSIRERGRDSAAWLLGSYSSSAPAPAPAPTPSPRGPGGTDFNLTPLFVGTIAIVAGLSSRRRRSLATGLVLAGWGAAVLAVAHGVVPADRTTPAYISGSPWGCWSPPGCPATTTAVS